MRTRFSLGCGFVISATLLSGCTPDPRLISFFNENIGKHIGLKLQSAAPVATTSPTPKPSETEPPLPSPDHRQVNAEFIKELFTTVPNRDLYNEEEFAKYMNVMDQGGHYEGIYNGIVYSDEYRQKETGVAPVRALKMYADIMAQIALDQRYDPLKIAKPDAPDVPKQDDAAAKPPQPTEAERASLVAEYEKEGITKSFYTLKRRLGEEALKTIDLKKEYREKLATWHGHFTVFLNKKGVEFNLPQRNRKDEYFHYKWALTAEEDRLKWETLNRLHVLMNAQAK